MRTALIVLILLLIAAGCGKGSSAPREQGSGQPAPDTVAGSVRLALSSEQDGAEWRVNLRAPQASDLYQVGGTLAFDPLKYEVVAVEAGGGLGQPDRSYFSGQETTPGRVAFAYTQRYWGPGASGNLWLVSLRVRPNGAFNLADFALDRESRLLARDSKKRAMTVEVGGAQ